MPRVGGSGNISPEVYVFLSGMNLKDNMCFFLGIYLVLYKALRRRLRGSRKSLSIGHYFEGIGYRSTLSEGITSSHRPVLDHDFEAI